jgi:hypothetical protein
MSKVKYMKHIKLEFLLREYATGRPQSWARDACLYDRALAGEEEEHGGG